MNDVLNPPCAFGEAVGAGRLRVVPEDFVVKEWLGFQADGEGDHWLLSVRKRGANTHWVAKQLARMAQISPRDVGFAGLKDRDALTEQSFTLPVRSAHQGDWTGVSGEGFEVLSAVRHRRKLKRGALRGNEFQIVVREWRGDAQALHARCNTIAEQGVPNYFGPQRFGRDGSNLKAAQSWFETGVPPQDRLERSFALSAARSAIFNAVLAERVRTGTWNTLQPGDIVNLNGSGSIFRPDAIDDILIERCRTLDIHPTGPLWGSSTEQRHDPIAELEQRIADRYATLSAGLMAINVEAERRALRVQVSDLQCSVEQDAVHLSFRLPRGAFATAVLHEILADAWTGAAMLAGED